jgi:chlorite dismutase
MSNPTELRRQFVTWTMYKLDPTIRRLPEEDKAAIRSEFAQAVDAKTDEYIQLTYSTVGLKTDTDFIVWRIAFESDVLQQREAALNKTRLAGYLTTSHRFLAMTKRSQYIDPVDPFHDENSRAKIVPGRRKYLFVYPFVKTRPWYLMSLEERQEAMGEHIRVGTKYPSVKLNTTYSFGLDDQEFVVAFETDVAQDFLDLVQELRETEASKYTLRDTPMFTCVLREMPEILDSLF